MRMNVTPFRMHTGTVDQDGQRFIRQMFSTRSLAGMGAATRSLPLVRGSHGWFYAKPGRRGGIGNLGQYANEGCMDHDSLLYAMGYEVAATVETGVDNCKVMQNQARANTIQQLMNQYGGCIPTGTQFNYSVPGCAEGMPIFNANQPVFATGSITLPAESAAAQAPATAPSPLPPTPAPVTSTARAASPVRVETQTQATAVTGRPNQSVPPRDTSVPLPTGTGASGGNPILNAEVTAAAPATGMSSNTMLLIGLGVAALFLFSGGHGQ